MISFKTYNVNNYLCIQQNYNKDREAKLLSSVKISTLGQTFGLPLLF